jgi:hypothetical protein
MTKVVNKSYDYALSRVIILLLYFEPGALIFFISYSGNPYYNNLEQL